MKTTTKHDESEFIKSSSDQPGKMHRRSFLGLAGLGAASFALLAAGCKKVADVAPQRSANNVLAGNTGVTGNVDLSVSPYDGGSNGEQGTWNYCYFLKQFEAAFYIKATTNFYSGATSDEKLYLQQIKKLVIAHREFFKATLDWNTDPVPRPTYAIPSLDFDFSKIDFSQRAQVGQFASEFTNLVIQAFSGATFLTEGNQTKATINNVNSVNARNALIVDYLFSKNQNDSYFPELPPLGYPDVLNKLNNSGYLKNTITAKYFPTYQAI